MSYNNINLSNGLCLKSEYAFYFPYGDIWAIVSKSGTLKSLQSDRNNDFCSLTVGITLLSLFCKTEIKYKFSWMA